MSSSARTGRIITFYSYKGGVGRSSAVVNVGWRLANKHGLKVLIVDFDLEAPGLHQFFGLTDKDLQKKKARGVTDYLAAWKQGLDTNASEPPSITSWALPIVDKQHKPKFGSLSLLVAGSDPGYAQRVASFDWAQFYRDHAGGAAIDHLRAQLQSMADVVLIDSRTGLTDIGGVCTLQLPDGVVLMTAANQQSLEGVERVAREIATHRKGSERAPARTWFVVSRVSRFEEASLARKWFADHEEWFAQGITAGLWKKEDHLNGIDSLTIPYSGLWSFGEQLIREAEQTDLLAQAYDQLAEKLFGEVKGDFRAPIADAVQKERSLHELREAARLAEKRRDLKALAVALRDLGLRLTELGDYDTAGIVLGRVAGIVEAQNYKLEQCIVQLFVAELSVRQGLITRAAAEAEASLLFSRKTGNIDLIAFTQCAVGRVFCESGRAEQGMALISDSIELATKASDKSIKGYCEGELGSYQLAAHRPDEAIASCDSAIHALRMYGESYAETQYKFAIAFLLKNDFQFAVYECSTALDVAQAHGDERISGMGLCWASEAHNQLGDEVAARNALERGKHHLQLAGVAPHYIRRIESVVGVHKPPPLTSERFDLLREAIELYPPGRLTDPDFIARRNETAAL